MSSRRSWPSSFRPTATKTTPASAWGERLRALMPPSVDETLPQESLALTPTQRLEKQQALVDAYEQLRRVRQ